MARKKKEKSPANDVKLNEMKCDESTVGEIDMTNVLVCPKCGKKPTFVYDESLGCYDLNCRECKTACPTTDTPGQAIKLWNMYVNAKKRMEGESPSSESVVSEHGILNCAQCGSEPTLEYMDGQFNVACHDCHMYSVNGKTEAEAVQKWNDLMAERAKMDENCSEEAVSDDNIDNLFTHGKVHFEIRENGYAKGLDKPVVNNVTKLNTFGDMKTTLDAIKCFVSYVSEAVKQVKRNVEQNKKEFFQRPERVVLQLLVCYGKDDRLSINKAGKNEYMYIGVQIDEKSLANSKYGFEELKESMYGSFEYAYECYGGKPVKPEKTEEDIAENHINRILDCVKKYAVDLEKEPVKHGYVSKLNETERLKMRIDELIGKIRDVSRHGMAEWEFNNMLMKLAAMLVYLLSMESEYRGETSGIDTAFEENNANPSVEELEKIWSKEQ